MSNDKRYVDKKTAELNDWKHELDELAQAAKETTGEVKAKLESQMAELHRLRQEGTDRLRRAVDASEDAVENLRDDVEHTWKAFRHSVNYFKSHFKARDNKPQA